jgi:hypothetical protein
VLVAGRGRGRCRADPIWKYTSNATTIPKTDRQARGYELRVAVRLPRSGCSESRGPIVKVWRRDDCPRAIAYAIQLWSACRHVWVQRSRSVRAGSAQLLAVSLLTGLARSLFVFVNVRGRDKSFREHRNRAAANRKAICTEPPRASYTLWGRQSAARAPGGSDSRDETTP